MATEALIVELDARTSKLDAKLKLTEKRLDELDGTVQKTEGSFQKMGSAAKTAVDAIVKTTVAVVAVGAAISAMVLGAASARRELEQFARQAKTTEKNFQSLAFSTKQYGINAEQIADISKDIADKVGEFSIAGTGAFQDYADVMRLTKTEAKAVALEFGKLSSEEVMGQMVANMQSVNATGNQMTFVMESIGNDASRLIPLFSNNSAELTKMKERFDKVNGSMAITNGQAEKLKEVATSFDLTKSSLGGAATAISATLAPVINDFFNDVIDIVPEATQTIIDFANSFLDAEHISSVAGVMKEIKASKEEIAKATRDELSAAGFMAEFSKAILISEKQRLKELEAQLLVLEDQERLADAKKQAGGEIGGVTGAALASGSGSGSNEELQAIADRFKSEITLLEEKYLREKEILDLEVTDIEERNKLIEELELELINNLIAADEKRNKKKTKSSYDLAKSEQSIQKSNVSSIMAITSALVGHNDKIGKILFIGSQALAASEVFFNTQVASARALAELGPIAGPPVAAAIQTSGQLSIAAIAATTLGSLGGGGGGGGIGSPASGGSSSPQQESFNPEQSSIGLDFRSENAQTSNVITFNTETGDELIDALAGMLNKNMRQGRG